MGPHLISKAGSTTRSRVAKRAWASQLSARHSEPLQAEVRSRVAKRAWACQLSARFCRIVHLQLCAQFLVRAERARNVSVACPSQRCLLAPRGQHVEECASFHQSSAMRPNSSFRIASRPVGTREKESM